jgi:hypothetical protein
MTDRERIDALLDQMTRLQQENKELKTYTEILESLLGVVHLESLD